MSPESLSYGPISEGSSTCLGTLVGSSAIGSSFAFWILGVYIQIERDLSLSAFQAIRLFEMRIQSLM